MRRFWTILTVFFFFGPLAGCVSSPSALNSPDPDHRPGDFRLGVVVMNPDQPASSNQANPFSALPGGSARYIVDSAWTLRASFGSGSSLSTYPGYTRRLNHQQMDALWYMTRDLLDTHSSEALLRTGQPQSMVPQDTGTVIELHMNARDWVFVFDVDDQRAAAIVDALSALSWADTADTSARTTLNTTP